MNAKQHMHLAEEGRRQAKRINFTVTALQAIKAPATGRAWIYDTKVPGLTFMLTSTGAASFYVYKRMDGRPERFRLGGFPELSIEQARRLAQQRIGDYLDGKNPATAKRSARAAASFGDLFTLYIDMHAKPKKRTWREDEAKYNQHLKQWASRKAGSITRDDVRALHVKIGKATPGAANRTLSLLSKVFAFAGITPNPARGIERFPEHSRERFIEPHEVPAFFTALGKEDQVWQDFFLCALLTGARSGNLQRMRWDNVDLPGMLWTIPETEFKTKRIMRIPLVPGVAEILKRRLAERGNGPDGKPCEWVFARSGGDHVTQPHHAWERIRQNSGLKDIRVHDLRRSCGSWQAALGSNISVIGKSLGHSAISTTAVYSRVQMDPVRASMGAAADAIFAAAAGKPAEAPKPEQAPPAPAVDILCELERLAKLKEAGILSDAEVATLKARLLG